MADTTLAIRDHNTGELQYLKLKDNGDSTYSLSTAATATFTLGELPAGNNNIGDVDVATIAAGENHIGEVGGYSINVSFTPTVTASSAYADRNCVGGLLVLSDAVRKNSGTAVLQDVILRSSTTFAAYLLFFNSNPIFSTITDKIGVVIHSSDITKIKRVVNLNLGDWSGAIDGKYFTTLAPISKVIRAASGRNLYMAIVLNTSTPTFATTTSLTGDVGFLND